VQKNLDINNFFWLQVKVPTSRGSFGTTPTAVKGRVSESLRLLRKQQQARLRIAKTHRMNPLTLDSTIWIAPSISAAPMQVKTSLNLKNPKLQPHQHRG